MVFATPLDGLVDVAGGAYGAVGGVDVVGVQLAGGGVEFADVFR